MVSPRSPQRTGSASPRQGPAKPRGAKKSVAPPRERVAPLEVLPVIEEEDAPIPALPPEPECAFPLEIKRGRCPVTVFNAPGDVSSMNESISFPAADRRDPARFQRGVLAVFSAEDAENVRLADKRGRLYVEADPRFGARPLMCTTCYPKTRWYSAAAYERHMKRHGNG
jgi:hypothetical protein